MSQKISENLCKKQSKTRKVKAEKASIVVSIRSFDICTIFYKFRCLNVKSTIVYMHVLFKELHNYSKLSFALFARKPVKRSQKKARMNIKVLGLFVLDFLASKSI